MRRRDLPARLPSAHLGRSHDALLDGLFEGAKAAFLDAERPWDPALSEVAGRLDLGAGLLDCYALSLHILWTYQEAWAQEGFLPSARLDASVHRLLQQVGHRPSPGSGAEGVQHFRLKAGQAATLSPGFRVKAPKEGGLAAVTFETTRSGRLDARKNELLPFLPEAAGELLDTAGAIASVAMTGSGSPALSAPTVDNPLGGGELVDQLANRLDAMRARQGAAREALDARRKARQLAEVLDTLEESGGDAACSETYAALCEELCEAQEAANQVVLGSPGPLSESQEILLGQLRGLSSRQPDAHAALLSTLERQECEELTAYTARIDALLDFLDGLVAGILQESRDQVVLLRGPRALARMDLALSDPRRGGAPGASRPRHGVARPGTDAVYLLPVVADPEVGPETQSDVLFPGEWLVFAEQIRRTDPQGKTTTTTRYREAVRVVSVREEVPEGRSLTMTRVVFTPPLRRRYTLGRTVILGNCLPIAQGETMSAALPLASNGRSIPLSRGPLTWLRDARAADGRVPQADLTVNGKAWTRVEDLRGSAPEDTVFSVETQADGTAHLVVGDGVEGAAPSATATLQATWRVGVGDDGNRASGTITLLVDSHGALEKTFNPLATSGGADAESSDLATARAQAGLGALDRAVSLADLRGLALSFDGVLRASVFRDPVRRREQLAVVVSGDDGEGLDAADLQDLEAFLSARVPPGTTVRVENRRAVALKAAVRLYLEPGADAVEVLRASRVALGLDEPAEDEEAGLLAPENTELGGTVDLSDLYEALRGVPELSWCVVDALYRADDSPRRAEQVALAPRELPVWAEPADGEDAVLLSWEETP